MFVYHIDRRNCLSVNQTLHCTNEFDLNDIFNIYNNSLSAHGIQYLTQNMFNDIPSFIWELATEYIRILKYPNYPSRFKCLFALENIEQIDTWKSIFNTSTYQIAKIECSKCYKFDANWLTKPRSFF